MAAKRTGGNWNPYLAGALAGLLAVGSAVATTRWLPETAYLGCSTTYVRAAGMIQRQVTESRVRLNAYYRRAQIKVDWQFMLVCGIFLGGLAGSATGRDFEWEAVPALWQTRFGASVAKRAVLGFLGGVVAMFGARLADGCPSGHGLSGMMQLSASALLATACFFIGGAMMARRIYRKGGRDA